MKYRKLGRTGIDVSQICLGSMTWGSQNTEAEGHEQISYAVDNGVNFIDAAELYPTTPSSEKTQGDTESIIGSWFKSSGLRDKIILATKVTGNGIDYIQNGAPISREKIHTSIEGSLQRLQTDYIDLYQLHWPNRGSYHFRQNWNYDPSAQDQQEVIDNTIELLDTLNSLVNEGKIRHIGLSNETAWGCSQFIRLAEENSFPRIASIQNEYSLLSRLFDLDLAELSHHEDVGLLAYSPLAAGMLTGKYSHGKIPEGSRRSMNKDLFGRYCEQSVAATEAYLDVARKHSLDPAQMAIAFCMTRAFMSSVIIGASNMQQLKNNIASAEIELSEAALKDIFKVYRKYPQPI